MNEALASTDATPLIGSAKVVADLNGIPGFNLGNVTALLEWLRDEGHLARIIEEAGTSSEE